MHVAKKLLLHDYCMILLMGMVFLITGCSNNMGPGNTLSTNKLGFLFQNKNNCSTLCWHDISPGISTSRDVQKLINTLPNDTIEQLQCQESNNNLEHCTWHDKKNKFIISIKMSDGIVEFIRFVPVGGMVPSLPFTDDSKQNSSNPPINLTRPTNTEQVVLQDIFESFGEPDEYSVLVLDSLYGESILTLNFFFQKGVFIHNIYTNLNLSNFTTSDSCKLDIPTNLPVNIVYFSKLTKLEQAIYESEFAPMVQNTDIQPWQGIDKINICK